MVARLVVVPLTVMAMTANCGGGPADIPGAGANGGGGGGGDAERAAEDLCTITRAGLENQSIFDEAKARCTAGEAPVFLESMPGGASKIAALRAQCKPGDTIFDMFARGIEGGRVRFDAARLEACLMKGKAARAKPSPAIFTPGTLEKVFEDPDCKGVVTPLVEEHGVCVDVWDCPRETACEADDPTVDVLRCLQPAGVGVPCGSFRTCDPKALFCGPSGTCAPRLGVGVACSTSEECVPTAFCSVVTQTCKATPGAGAACEDVCAEGLQCTGGTCVPTPAPAADGAGCYGTTCAGVCSVCRPEKDGDSEAQYKCLPRASLGGPCGASDFSCVAGLVCNASTGHCEAPLAAGADCTAPGVRCADDLFCDELGSHTCVALPGAGAACYQGMCAEGLACSLGLCVAGELGDRCDPADVAVCQSALFCGGAPGVETCQPLPGPGEACAGGSCADGAFCNASSVCEAQRAVGAPCDDASQCAGDCYKGKCAPAVPGGCGGDLRDMLASIFAMGVMSVISRRRREEKA